MGQSVGGRKISNFRFAHSSQRKTTYRVNKSIRKYGMGMSNGKSKLMVTSKRADDGRTTTVMINDKFTRRGSQLQLFGIHHK